ncbi:MAG: alpha-L-rhamnosidase, partial [Chitinophagales bacterium]
MGKRNILIIAFFTLQYAGFSQLAVRNLVVENLTNPIGLDLQDPRFGWQLVSDQRNTMQSAYEIKMSSNGTNVWNTGKVISDQSTFIEYAGAALQSGKRYQW